MALNQPSDPQMGVLAPTADAADKGLFGTQAAWPVIPVHVSLGRNGHLTSWGTPLDTAQQGGTAYDDWDVSAGLARGAHTETASMNDYHSFCNGPVTLPDGPLLMVGGNSTQMTMIYDPVTHQQTMGQNVRTQRWYATSLRLTDGRVLVLGGGNYDSTGAYKTPNDDSGVARIPAFGSGTGAWTQLTGANSALAFGAEDDRWWYPRAFNGPIGTVVGTSGDEVWNLSTAGTGAVTQIGTLPFNPRVCGSQVMYAPGKVLVAGGGQAFNEDAATATAAAAVVDVSGATAKVTSTAAMANNRNWLNLTVLPTGDVLANGGTRVGTQAGDGSSVRQAEVWSPATGTWRAAATAQRTRTYHSTSVLLPSGAVFTGGGGVPGPEDDLNAELYYPASLFAEAADGTVSWASRPAITALAGTGTYGGTLATTIGDGRTIASASLISIGSTTHSENTDQRRVPLTITQKGRQGHRDAADLGQHPAPGRLPPDRRRREGRSVSGAGRHDARRCGGAGHRRQRHPGAGCGRGGGHPRRHRPPHRRHRRGPGGRQLRRVPDPAPGLRRVPAPGRRRQRRGGQERHLLGGPHRPGLRRRRLLRVARLARPPPRRPRGGAGAAGLVKGDGTAAFAARATFAPVTGATGQNTSFQVWGD